jgi:transcriptional regulator with XRE-family HTH domain
VEKGDRNPTLESLLDLAVALDTPLSNLIANAEEIAAGDGSPP